MYQMHVAGPRRRFPPCMPRRPLQGPGQQVQLRRLPVSPPRRKHTGSRATDRNPPRVGARSRLATRTFTAPLPAVSVFRVYVSHAAGRPGLFRVFRGDRRKSALTSEAGA